MNDLSLKSIVETLAEGNTITMKEHDGDIVVGIVSNDRTAATSQIFQNRYLKDLTKSKQFEELKKSCSEFVHNFVLPEVEKEQAKIDAHRLSYYKENEVNSHDK